jgi:hypothetical protein
MQEEEIEIEFLKKNSKVISNILVVVLVIGAIMVKVEDGRHVGYIKEEQTGMVRTWVGAEQLGVEEPTIFKPYRVEGFIDEREDEDGRKYYDGCVYLKKNR